jgi:catechol 2,3-dioxygenase-like lactoylglutathione lyase family enzyme
MSDSPQSPTTTSVTNIGVVMFTVSDVDASLAFYTDKLGFEVRQDVSFGENGEYRWVEIAPPGSVARLSLNPPMNGTTPGGCGIGVETTDLPGEHERLKGLGVGVQDIMQMPNTPAMFMLSDPDGNWVTVVDRSEG